MFNEIFAKTLRVPALTGDQGNGAQAARQLDGALMSVGFKLSAGLLRHMSGFHPAVVKDTGAKVLGVVRELVGDHVRHNVYFKDFPDNVPDTVEFWFSCIIDALFDSRSASTVALQLETLGTVNLLDLPRYGRYQHTYEEMLAAHEQFIPNAKDRVTILHLGGSLRDETVSLYKTLAESPIPLNEGDRELLKKLAEACLDDEQPDQIPVRENRAVVNQVRLAAGQPLLIDTVTDVLRLAAAVSGGDVTLVEKFRFTSLPRAKRRVILQGLNALVASAPHKLADVLGHRELWKRLGERLHPHEHAELPHAQDVFCVARGDKHVHSLAAKVELAIGKGNILDAATLLAVSPGMLFRSLDRLIRLVQTAGVNGLAEIVKGVIGKVSGRVLLSVREHLQNRASADAARVFVNRAGKTWVTKDEREPLSPEAVGLFTNMIDEEVLLRLPAVDHLVVDPDVRTLAVPLSDKSAMGGFSIMPRGSTCRVDEDVVRFFVYWKQKAERTDFDLSALMLDQNFQMIGQISWTNLSGVSGVHSGDITQAPNGASEFIDLNLKKVLGAYIVPQVNVYAGEGFNQVEEAFFGFMGRTSEQMGQPFEARTVRMKSDLRDAGRVALPLVFARNAEGGWTVRWLHLYLKGQASCNRVEANRASTSLLARGIVERNYLTVGYLTDLLARKARRVSEGPVADTVNPVFYVGLAAPEFLPEGSRVVTLANLRDLTPA